MAHDSAAAGTFFTRLCAPLNGLISTLVLVSALVQVFFLLLLHTLCSCTPPRTLNPCTLLPPCIDAKPSPTSPAHMHRMSSMHRRCHIVPRVVLCSAAAWAESYRGHLIHHFHIVHLVCRSACSRPPRVLPRTSQSSPSQGEHHSALPRTFSLEHCLEQYRTPTLSATSLSSPLPSVHQVASINGTLRHTPTCQPRRSLCCSLMCAVCYFLHSARP